MKRLSAWIIMIVITISVFVGLLVHGFTLNTNLLDLLPSHAQNTSAMQAADQFEKNRGNQLIFLLGDSDKEQAQKAALLFVATLKQSGQFSDFNYQVTNDTQQAWGAFYFPYRLSLLTHKQQQSLQNHDVKKVEQDALFNLYNPMGIANSAVIANDPFFTFQNFIMSLPKPSSHIQLQDQFMMAQAQGKWYVLVTTQIRGDSFSINNQEALLTTITQAQDAVQVQYPSSTIIKTGMLFYAKAGADAAQHDISTIGIGSLLGIVLLLLLTFRSISPLLFTLFSTATGFVAAFVVTYWLFGTIYLFTLVFGTSLIGISVDYAFFYYADALYAKDQWNPQQGLRRILPGISLGLLNVVLAFVIMAFAPFPGLRQLAVFAIVGLSMSYATVVCFFPYIIKSKQQKSLSMVAKLADSYLLIWRRLSNRKIVIILSAIILFCGIGLTQLHIDDDIHVLESNPVALTQDENAIKKIIGSQVGMDFILVQGDSEQSALQNTETLTQAIKQNFPDINQATMSISDYLPTVDTQKANYDLVTKELLGNNLLNYLKKIGVTGVKAKQINEQLSTINFKPLTVDSWLNSPVSQAMQFLWLGKTDNNYYTVVLLDQRLPVTGIKSLVSTNKNMYYVNKADEVSNVFAKYRKIVLDLLGLALAGLFILLIMRYRYKKAIYYFIPPVLSGLVGIAILGWLSIPLTLFNLLAVILVLGISVDYVLFFAESKQGYHSTMLAVLLSAVTTILSFGLLALSSTPVVRYFGITCLVGIITAFLLAPAVTRIKEDKS